MQNYDERAKKLISEISKLLAEMSAEVWGSEATPKVEKTIQEKHMDAIKKARKVFYLDAQGIASTKVFSADEEIESDKTGCSHYYLDSRIALMASEIKVVTDLMLMYKWAYDRDYRPNWQDDSEKFTISKYMQKSNSPYEVIASSCMRENTVYFSSYEIAQGCADWLNEIFELN